MILYKTMDWGISCLANASHVSKGKLDLIPRTHVQKATHIGIPSSSVTQPGHTGESQNPAHHLKIRNSRRRETEKTGIINPWSPWIPTHHTAEGT